MEIKKGTAEEIGGCNECKKLISTTGNFTVYEIELRTIGFRLCDDCLKKLYEEINWAFYLIDDGWLEQAWKEIQPLIDKYSLCKKQRIKRI